MSAFKIVGEHRGFSTECAVRVLQDRNQVGTQMLSPLPKRLGHDDPIEGYPSIPHQGAELDGVGRGRRANQLVTHFHFNCVSLTFAVRADAAQYPRILAADIPSLPNEHLSLV